MKFLTIISLLTTIKVLAAPKTEVFETRALVSVAGIQCIAEAGSTTPPTSLKDRLYTQFDSLKIMNLKASEAPEMTHKVFTQKGCDMDALDQIAEEAWQSFSFLHDVSVKITKETFASIFYEHIGCLAQYEETIELDLGHGVIIKSVQSDGRFANDCTP